MKTQKIKRCPVCGFKIRGKNHDDGPHHKKDAAVVKNTKR